MDAITTTSTRWRAQRSLFCRWCAAALPTVAGFCKSCYRRTRRDATYFGGQREHVLERDGRSCRICGEGNTPRHLHVHHRRPGLHDPDWLVALCAACHARVHRLLTLRAWLPDDFVELWREQHPDVSLQMQFPFTPMHARQEAAA